MGEMSDGIPCPPNTSLLTLATSALTWKKERADACSVIASVAAPTGDQLMRKRGDDVRPSLWV